MHILKIDNNNKKNIIAFEAMKPNQFKGIDYAVVRKFKAPVEQFNNMQDFQNWAEKLLQTFYKMEFKSIFNHATIQRRFCLNRWKEFLASKIEEFSPAEKLLIFASMQKNLKIKNETIPPIVNASILEKSLGDTEFILEKNKDKPFDFNKIYRNNLAEYYLSDIPSNYTGWVKMNSKRKDPDNYEKNVEKLKLLSHKKWCTKRDYHAESYLSGSEMHIYLESGKPKIGIRVCGCEIQEVQGEKNNSVIPEEYLDEVKRYIEKTEYYLNEDVEFMMELSRVMD